MRSPLRPAPALVFACALFVAVCAAGARAQNSYQVSQSLGVGMTPGTTKLSGFTCAEPSLPNEDCVAPVALPFPYAFYGQTFTAANVSTNGVLQFASADTDAGQSLLCFPLSQFNYAILPHWTDMQTNGAGEGIFTSVTGAPGSRVFNIEWRGSYSFLPPGTLNFEVRLYEGQQRFDIVYGAVAGSGMSAPGGGIQSPAVGAQQGTGGRYTAFSSACGLTAGGLRSGLMLTFTGMGDAGRFIAGRVADPDGHPLSGVTVTLSGDASAQATTGTDGRYRFSNLSGTDYTVAAAQAGQNFYPGSRVFGLAPFAPFSGNQVIDFVRTRTPAPGDLLITEFRFRGPRFITNEFVELYNNTNSTIIVNTADGSQGWTVRAANPSPPPAPPPGPSPAPTPPPGGTGELATYVLPLGTLIPPRAHFLVSGNGYDSLFHYAASDDFFTLGGDIPDDDGVAVFSTADPSNLTDSTRIDAVGFNNAARPVAPLYREGAGLTPIDATHDQYQATLDEYSWVRKLASGLPQDTNDNAADFVFVSTSGAALGAAHPILGAPGPENIYTPTTRNTQIKASYADPGCVVASTNLVSACARVRDNTPVNGGALGTLSLRRRWTNQADAPVTRLRFRVVDLSTLGNRGAGEADLRVLSSADVSLMGTNGAVEFRALTLDQMPNIQVPAGGLNSGLSVGSITLASPLAPGASVNVEFRLGVQIDGNYRFSVNVEALTATPPAPVLTGSGSKTGGGFPPTRPKIPQTGKAGR